MEEGEWVENLERLKLDGNKSGGDQSIFPPLS